MGGQANPSSVRKRGETTPIGASGYFIHIIIKSYKIEYIIVTLYHVVYMYKNLSHTDKVQIIIQAVQSIMIKYYAIEYIIVVLYINQFIEINFSGYRIILFWLVI